MMTPTMAATSIAKTKIQIIVRSILSIPVDSEEAGGIDPASS
jgi:hypothetical protein